MVPLGDLIEPAGSRAGSDAACPVYSVTKHDGFVPSAEYFKKQVFSRDLTGYKRVRPGEFAYATIHLDEGAVGVAPADALISPMYTVFRANATLVNSGYLLRYLKSPVALAQYSRFGKGSVHRRKAISLDALGRLPTPLPSLDEQRRIAAILDQADALRAQRRELIAHLDGLTRSLFTEMFGDAVRNECGWDVVDLSDVVTKIDNGTSPVCEARPARGDEWAVLKLGAVSYGVFNHDENKAFLGDRSTIRCVEAKPGDLLFSRKNTKELVGATVVVHDVPPRRLLPDLIFRLELKRERVEAEYLHALLSSPWKRPQVVALASGSASSMSNISKSRLFGLQIELPPIQLQRAYSERMREVLMRRAQCQQAGEELDALFASLQSRAFRGEL